MTLEEKIGRMFIAPARGYFSSANSSTFAEIEQHIRNNHVGGFRLYGGEVVQTAALTNRMQAMSKLPLFFSSDVEAGLGSEFEGGTRFPALMSVGASNSAEVSYQMGGATAIEARAVGLNMVQSPVLDVNNNPMNPIINYRSFGEDPDEVSRLGVTFIRGLQEHGVISTVKHYPGHGDTDIDSHIELPVVQHDRARLDSVELVPFRAAVQENAGAIMVAHMGLPRVHSQRHEETGVPLPATLSPAMLEGVLRNEQEYDGLLITDALWMGGITELFSPGEAAIRAVNAGNDNLPHRFRHRSRSSKGSGERPAGRGPDYRQNAGQPAGLLQPERRHYPHRPIGLIGQTRNTEQADPLFSEYFSLFFQLSEYFVEVISRMQMAISHNNMYTLRMDFSSSFKRFEVGNN